MTRARRELIVLLGAPGAGKSTLADNLTAQTGYNLVTTDELATGTHTAERTTRVFNDSFTRITQSLAADQGVIFDTTAINPLIRRRCLQVARGYHARARLIYISTPLEICQARRSTGRRSIDPDDVAELHESARIAWMTCAGEAWHDRQIVAGYAR